MKVATAGTGLIVVAGVIAGIAMWHSKPPVSTRATPDEAEAPRGSAPDAAPVPPTARASPPSPLGTPGPNARTTRRDDPAPITEARLMTTLREMGGTAPDRSLALAREGQRRFPNSADAPERAFIVVQSLVNLKRFHEARDEARAMVRHYPDNQFALDAQRHLLVYPLDQPSREEMQRTLRPEPGEAAPAP
jgi:hypothetical protein